ncbi:MAG: VWA domain-containing protein [Acidobacteriia bacterium]|nr:VWA domain-containing protein [Terriglobia bacterium]
MLRFGLAAAFGFTLVLQPYVQSNQGPGRTSAQSDKQRLPGRISDQTYRVPVDLVNVFVSVYNKDTKSFVTNLAREDFTVYEDGKKQEITNFAREANLPLTLGLLVDTSNSVAPKLKFEQEAASNFFYTVLKPGDRAMLVEFDSAVTMSQDFTNDPNKLAKQIKLMQAAGNTALYDAIVRTCDEKLIRETGRKAIVILSDGDDSASTETLERARQMAVTAEATIFSISVNRGGFFGVGGDTRAGDKVLRQLATETGGQALFPFQVEELDSSFREISQELRSQYNIGYVSSNLLRDGGYRKIEVKVAEKNLQLHYRKGYFAPTGKQ